MAFFEKNTVKIKNIRFCKYRSSDDYDIAYYDKDFDLNDIAEVDYIMEPFSSWNGPAHAFLSFGFRNKDKVEYISISIEIRKKIGDYYSPFKGLFRNYEVMYVIADERDVIKLRANYRKDNVYLYPLKLKPAEVKSLFLKIISKVNKLSAKPEFYNTITNMCTISMVKHINDVVDQDLPKYSLEWFLPAFSDRLLYKLGLIDTNLPIDKIRDFYQINKLAEKYSNSDNFSARIRQGRI